MTKKVSFLTLGLSRSRAALMVCLGFTFVSPVFADAPGKPGLPFSASPAPVQAMGTSAENSSRVWFTVSEGSLGRVFYPTPDAPLLADFEMVFTDGHSWVSRQKRDMRTTVSFAPGGMTVLIKGEDPENRFGFEQEIITDTNVAVVRMRTTLHMRQPGIRVFAVVRPHPGAGNSPNLISAQRDQLATSDFVVLPASGNFAQPSAGYVGFSDAITELERSFSLSPRALAETEAGPGHVSASFEITPPTATAPNFVTEWAIGFGRTRVQAQLYAQASLAIPFERARLRYEKGWLREIETAQNSRLGKTARFTLGNDSVRRSFVLLKMHEDKSTPGWFVPALGGTSGLSARELYRVALALLAFGDTETPRMIFRVLARDSAAGSALLLLGAQLSQRLDAVFTGFERRALADAAANLTGRGPKTPGIGISAGMLAFDIAALRAAATPALSEKISGGGISSDAAARALGETIDLWQSKIESWTYVDESYLAKGYYVRNPQESFPAPTTWELTDPSFLDLTRFGVRSPSDPRIIRSLQIFGLPEFRTSLKGAADQGIFHIAAGELTAARAQLAFMEKQLNSAGLFCEAVACPSLSSHAEYLNLQRSLEEGRPFDRIR